MRMDETSSLNDDTMIRQTLTGCIGVGSIASPPTFMNGASIRIYSKRP